MVGACGSAQCFTDGILARLPQEHPVLHEELYKERCCLVNPRFAEKYYGRAYNDPRFIVSGALYFAAGAIALSQITFLFLKLLADVGIGCCRRICCRDPHAYHPLLLDLWDLSTLTKIIAIGLPLGTGKFLSGWVRDPIVAYRNRVQEERTLTPSSALLVIDMQNDTVPVDKQGEHLDRVTELIANFQGPIVGVQQWNSIRQDFGSAPRQCIGGSFGATFLPGLEKHRFHHIVYPGLDPTTDCLHPPNPSRSREAPQKPESNLFDTPYLAKDFALQRVKKIYIIGAVNQLQADRIVDQAIAKNYKVKWISHACLATMPANHPKSEVEAVEWDVKIHFNIDLDRDFTPNFHPKTAVELHELRQEAQQYHKDINKLAHHVGKHARNTLKKNNRLIQSHSDPGAPAEIPK